MKPYLLFSGDQDPDGGWADFDRDFDTLEEAKAYMNDPENNFECEWADVIHEYKTVHRILNGEIIL